MSYKNEILKLLKEEMDDSITVTSPKDELQDTISTVKDASNSDSSLKGKVKVDVTAEGMDDLMVPDDAEAHEADYKERDELMKQAAKETSNEGIEPLSGVDMKQFYNKKVKRKSDGLIGDVVRWGASQIKVKITDGEHTGKVFTASPEEVEILDNSVQESLIIGRMSKGKLERLVEQNKKIGAAYKKIIKVSELKTKNG